MTAKIWTIANQKGGAGKTSVTMCLAGALSERGKRILVVDADRQGTATQWAASAPEDKPFPATMAGLASAGGKLHQMIKPMVEDYDHILIDCPPSVEEKASHSALMVSDLCIVPIQPTPADMWASMGLFRLIENVVGMNPELQSFAVANRVGRRKFASDVIEMIKENGIPLLDSRITDKSAFEQAPVFGSYPAAMGKPHKAAAMEIEAVLDEVFSRMGW